MWNPRRWGLTSKCRQVTFTNITYCEKPILCLRDFTAQGIQVDSCGWKNSDIEDLYTQKKVSLYYKLERKMHRTMASACQIKCKFQDLESQEFKKYYENLKTSQNNCLVLSLTLKITIFSVLVKIPCKAETELFPKCAVSHESQILSQKFCE